MTSSASRIIGFVILQLLSVICHPSLPQPPCTNLAGQTKSVPVRTRNAVSMCVSDEPWTGIARVVNLPIRPTPQVSERVSPLSSPGLIPFEGKASIPIHGPPSGQACTGETRLVDGRGNLSGVTPLRLESLQMRWALICLRIHLIIRRSGLSTRPFSYRYSLTRSIPAPSACNFSATRS
jgi:hypothetical protein